jgi:hypothetical protein
VTTISTGYVPHEGQIRLHLERQRFTVVVAHRRWGKTVAAIAQLVDGGLRCTKESGRFGYLAPFRNQAKAVAWDYLLRYARHLPGAVVNESELWVEFSNAGGYRSRVRLYGADNADAMRGGYFDGIVVDEVADMRPNVWGEILRPALSDRLGWALFIGTPKGINLFSELYYFALSGKEPGWVAMMFPASQTGRIPQSELDAARNGGMTPAQYAQEFECDFAAASEDSLIPLGEARAAVGRVYHATEFEFAPRIIGIDVARKGGDRTSIQRRQGLVAFEPIVRLGNDNMEVASLAAATITQWNPDAVFVDAGRGEGVIDRLRQLGYVVIEVPFGGTANSPRYENRKAEMWALMADWIKNGGALPRGEHAETFVADLTAPRFDYANARGKFSIESKDDLKDRGLRSPDLADALALTFAYPVAKSRDAVTGMPLARTGSARTDYDVLA